MLVSVVIESMHLADEDEETDFTETKTAKFSNQEVVAGATLSGTGK